MKEITYIKGDATEPHGTGLKYILHCCNDQGGWGSGFVLALSAKSKEPERVYREWATELATANKEDNTFKLGNYKVANFDKSDVCVVNIIGQHNTRWIDGVPPIRYEAIEKALTDLTVQLKGVEGASVHAPKFGSDLAGGDWLKIQSIIHRTLCSADIPVTIYLFDK
jgi:O-acetyl-ADP-ribose deacetylase (regulator of RNase III)